MTEITDRLKIDKEWLQQNTFDEFGYLTEIENIQFDKYFIIRNSVFEENIEYMIEKANKDKYYYPPLQNKFTYDAIENRLLDKIPNTEKPALLFKVVPTHAIGFIDKKGDTQLFRTNEGALILRVLSILYSKNLQFHDWWWTSRIPVNVCPIAIFDKNGVIKNLELALDTWRKWNEKSKKTFVNICYYYLQAKSYEWTHEQFISFYICIDAIWSMIKEIKAFKNQFHAKRIVCMCDFFNMHRNKDVFDSITVTRNNLFHEGIWGAFGPNNNVATDKRQLIFILEQNSLRLIFALLGIAPKFVQSNWESHFRQFLE